MKSIRLSSLDQANQNPAEQIKLVKLEELMKFCYTSQLAFGQYNSIKLIISNWSDQVDQISWITPKELDQVVLDIYRSH